MWLQQSAGNTAVGTLLSSLSSQARGVPEVQRKSEQTAPKSDRLLLDRIWAELQKSHFGQEAIRAQKRFGVTIKFIAMKPGSSITASYDPDSNSITLDSRASVPSLVDGAVHELYHAQQYRSGASPSAKKSADRDEYVRRMVAEELVGFQRGYWARLVAGGSTQLKSVLDTKPWPAGDGYQDYVRAYDYAYQKYIKMNKADKNGAIAAGKKNGDRRVAWDIKHGTLSPAGFQTYASYYRRQWDRTHKFKP